MDKKQLGAWKADFLASWVVFLVALPLSIGIAVACGVPEDRAAMVGLLTAAIGGVITAVLGGSPLQVSGPAAGLIVMVQDIVHHLGWEGLAIALVLSGFIQIIAGLLRAGYIFRAVTPGLLEGMLAAIGFLILISQAYRILGVEPPGEGLALGGIMNGLFLPVVFWKVVREPAAYMALMLALLTLVGSWGWERYAPGRWKRIPGTLVGAVLSAAVALSLKLPVTYLSLPENASTVFRFLSLESVRHLLNHYTWISAFIIAFIASTESLLTASAVDAMQNRAPRTNYNKELIGQGAANVVCGVLGLLPVTGVIARSSANVLSGAQSRLSSILHGVWILVFLIFLPGVIRHVPQATISAVLIYGALRLLSPAKFWHLWRHSRSEGVVFLITFLTTVGIDLFIGVIVGLVGALTLLLIRVSRVQLKLRYRGNRRLDIYLSGVATFVQMPVFTALFSRLPRNMEIYLRGGDLTYVDYTCHSYFQELKREFEAEGGSLHILLTPESPEETRSSDFIPAGHRSSSQNTCHRTVR